MGSKGSSSPPPQMTQSQEAPGVDMTPMFAMMGQLMAMNAASQQQNMEALYSMQAAAPKASPSEQQDWQKRADDLRAKIAADEADAEARRRGRESTVLTSPLTDEEVSTTESVLTGKP